MSSFQSVIYAIMEMCQSKDHLFQASWGHGFPVAGFLTAFGFFLVLTMEQIVLDYKETENINRPSPGVSWFSSSISIHFLKSGLN